MNFSDVGIRSGRPGPQFDFLPKIIPVIGPLTPKLVRLGRNLTVQFTRRLFFINLNFSGTFYMESLLQKNLISVQSLP